MANFAVYVTVSEYLFQLRNEEKLETSRSESHLKITESEAWEELCVVINYRFSCYAFS